MRVWEAQQQSEKDEKSRTQAKVMHCLSLFTPSATLLLEHTCNMRVVCWRQALPPG